MIVGFNIWIILKMTCIVVHNRVRRKVVGPMRRKQLESFKNRKVIVWGTIDTVKRKSKLNRNVLVLLKNVTVSGVHVDHLWLYEHQSYYDTILPMVGEVVRFKAKVVPYLKNRNGIFFENYGVERCSRMILRETYEKQFEEPEEKFYEFDEMDNPFKEIME